MTVRPNTPGRGLCPACPDDVGEVLHERAAEGDVEHLQAAAHREDRAAQLQRPRQDGQLGGVALGARRAGARVGLGAVAGRVDVGAAREHHAVEPVDGRRPTSARGASSTGRPPAASTASG